MKKIISIYLVLALMGCTASNDEPGYGLATGTAIKFATGMAPAITTRGPIESNNNRLITEEIAGVQILRDDASAAFANGITAKAAEATIKTESTNNKNLMSVAPVQYFKVDHSDAHFMAYYPNGSLSSGKVTYTINGTQDIITSGQETAEFGSKEEISFLFKHQLTRVKLQVKAENDSEAAAFGKLTKANISVPVNLELSIDGTNFKLVKSNQTTNSLSFLPANQPVVLKGGTQLIGELMIYPERFDAITLAFTHKPEQSFLLTWDSSKLAELLEPGTTNTITIDLKAFEIKFTATVSPWGSGNGLGEEISIGGS